MTGLRRIILVLTLTCQFHFIFAISYIPKLRGNRLSEDEDRNLPGKATPISCGGVCVTEATILRTMSISDILTTHNFKTYAMTAAPVVAPGAQLIYRDTGRFSFVEVKGTRHWQYLLQVDATGVEAYWLPQGGTIDIPQHPGIGQPRYVFTPDFSGCSWTMTFMDNGKIRLRHVEGSYEAQQFNNLSQEEKGGPETSAMEYKEYGYVMQTTSMVSNVPAFAYMKYVPGGINGRWKLSFQRKTCSHVAGGLSFSGGNLNKVLLVETSSIFPQVHSTKSMLLDEVFG